MCKSHHRFFCRPKFFAFVAQRTNKRLRTVIANRLLQYHTMINTLDSVDKQERKKDSLYAHIERAYRQVPDAIQLSRDFQRYSSASHESVAVSAHDANNKCKVQKLQKKWQSVHKRLDSALLHVTANLSADVLTRFDDDYIVIVFYSVVANFESSANSNCDGTAPRTNCQQKWPRLDGDDDVTASAYQLSRQIETALVQHVNRGANSNQVLRQRMHVPLCSSNTNAVRSRQSTLRLNESAACTSTGYFGDGCRVTRASAHEQGFSCTANC